MNFTDKLWAVDWTYYKTILIITQQAFSLKVKHFFKLLNFYLILLFLEIIDIGSIL